MPEMGIINFFCRNCQSHPGKKCTVPTNTGRKEVIWFHAAREDDFKQWVMDNAES